jgi:hypothetical protein
MTKKKSSSRKPRIPRALRITAIILLVLIGIWLIATNETCGTLFIAAGVLAVLAETLLPVLGAAVRWVRQQIRTIRFHDQLSKWRQYVWLCYFCGAELPYLGEDAVSCPRCRNAMNRVIK